MTLTKDQETKISAKRRELTGDAKKGDVKSTRPSDHKSMDMYGAFGTGGGEEWGGGGGTRGDECVPSSCALSSPFSSCLLSCCLSCCPLHPPRAYCLFQASKPPPLALVVPH